MTFRKRERVIRIHDDAIGSVVEVDGSQVLVWWSLTGNVSWIAAGSLTSARNFDARSPLRRPGGSLNA